MPGNNINLSRYKHPLQYQLNKLAVRLPGSGDKILAIKFSQNKSAHNAHDLLDLQHNYGNRRVQRMLFLASKDNAMPIFYNSPNRMIVAYKPTSVWAKILHLQKEIALDWPYYKNEQPVDITKHIIGIKNKLN